MQKRSNKTARFLFASLGLLALVGCSALPYRPVYPINLSNVAYNLIDYRDLRVSESTYSQISPIYEVVPESFKRLERGFAEIYYPAMHDYGTFSFLTGEIAVPAKYTQLTYLDKGQAGVYVLGDLRAPEGTPDYTSENQLCDLYDYRGGLVASSFLKKDYSFETVIFKNSFGDTGVAEHFSTSSSSSFFQVGEDGVRTELKAAATNLFYFPSGLFVPFHSSLKVINLARYSGLLYSTGWFRCTLLSNGTWVDFKIPSRMDHYALFNKALVYQNVSEATEDYDYVDGGKKYKLSTHQIAVVNGHDTSLTFPYKIENMTPIYDEDHVAMYAKVDAYPIRNKQLGELQTFIIQNDGVVLSDVTGDPAYSSSLSLLDNEHFLDLSNRTLLNNNFAIGKTLSIVPTNISYALGCFALSEGGKENFYSFSGASLLQSDFVSSSIAHPYEGCGLVKDASGTYYSLDLQKFTASKIPAEIGYFIHDFGNGFLRFQCVDTCYYRSYSLAYNPDDPNKGVLLYSSQGKTFFDEFAVDVLKDTTGVPYSFRAFYLR